MGASPFLSCLYALLFRFPEHFIQNDVAGRAGHRRQSALRVCLLYCWAGIYFFDGCCRHLVVFPGPV